MNKLYVLGTGRAMVTKCFNTCFTLYNGKEHFLVDTGGGNGILAMLEKAEIDVNEIHDVFVSHKHTDHLFGVFWIIRRIIRNIIDNKYTGDLNIYCHEELPDIITTISSLTIQTKFLVYFGNRIKLISVKDREKINICGNEIQFIDLNSTKDLQYGFIATLNDNKKVTFLGDETYKSNVDELIQNSDWFLSESFCLYAEREKIKPYEKCHNTVKESSEIANRLNAKNLVLWHTEDKNILNRKELYTAEAKQYYNGNIYVPDDLDVIEL